MNGVEVGRFYLPEADKIFITYMFSPKDVDTYDRQVDETPICCKQCGEYGSIMEYEGQFFCQQCGFRQGE